MRSHLGVAMVCMVNATAIQSIALQESKANDSDHGRISTKFFGIESPFDESTCYNPMKQHEADGVNNGYKVRITIFHSRYSLDSKCYSFYWTTYDYEII